MAYFIIYIFWVMKFQYTSAEVDVGHHGRKI